MITLTFNGLCFLYWILHSLSALTAENENANANAIFSSARKVMDKQTLTRTVRRRKARGDGWIDPHTIRNCKRGRCTPTSKLYWMISGCAHVNSGSVRHASSIVCGSDSHRLLSISRPPPTLPLPSDQTMLYTTVSQPMPPYPSISHRRPTSRPSERKRLREGGQSSRCPHH